MLAVVLPGVGQPLDVRWDHPEPDPAAGELIDVTACGVCHSDLHVVDGDYPTQLPIVLGHEVTGVHAELGPVMMYAPWGCRHCEQCRDGLEMMCPTGTEAGLVVDGGYCERMVVKDRAYLAPLGDLDPIAAAPLACGGLTAYRAVVHSLETLRKPGARAMVVGAGGLGQFAIRYLRLLTDAEVVAVDRAADKRETALAIGAHEAAAEEDLTARGGNVHPVDVVLDFAGVEPTLAVARDMVRRRGLVVVVGLGGGRIPFGFAAVPHEARFMTSVWGSRAQLDELLDLARREPSIVQPVEVLPLTEAQTAHDRLRAGDVRGRIVLVPSTN